jgi:predicted amidohydrolase YtcJ
VSSLLLRDAELAGTRRADLRVRDGIVAEIAPALAPLPGEEVLDCAAGAVIPGLCDHHLHLHAMAAASLPCGPPRARDRAALAAVLAAAVPDESGWIRGTGYVESVAGDLDAAALDAMRADVPVRVQHRSGALWMLNTAALIETGIAGPESGHPGVERDAGGNPTGRLWRADEWLRDRVSPSGRPRFPSLAAVGAQILGYGITAVTDATPDLDDAAIGSIAGAVERAELPPRVHLLGVRLGAAIPAVPGLTVGPYKIVLADSGMLTYPELLERVSTAHGAGRPVAVHCVTREALVLLVAVLRETGTRRGDRIEHAGVVWQEGIEELAGLGVRVVTQPGFLADRGDDFLDGTPPAEHADLYRCASLLRAGVGVALSSDAPYGPLDPWKVMSAATTRRTASGRVAGATERIGFAAALDAYLGAPEDPGGTPRRLRAGAPADLLVLGVPLAGLPGAPEPVRAVVAAGRLAR